ncbi:MAG: Gfo/Idh/MocA family oxidoreductase [Solobacterium sp.]|nr:Gfo/Idh/MocA family oxidoreductase [Solobacterium sp.]
MIRWGIIGAGNIASRFSASLKNEPDSVLVAVSCRTMEKAQAFADKYGARKAYDSYEALLDDPDIDAVYVSLPHHLHRQWSIAAMEKGKAVLCEKPAALNTAETREILACAEKNRVLFMEAMKGRFTPAAVEIRQMLESGSLGKIRRIRASFCYQMREEHIGKTYHTDSAAGGCLLDMGIYCASWLEEFFAQPWKLSRIRAACRNGVEMYAEAFYTNGSQEAELECAFDRNGKQLVTIETENAVLTVKNTHRPSGYILEKDGVVTEKDIPYINDDFYTEISHFCSLLKEGKTESSVMTYSAILHEAELIEAAKNSLHYTDEALCLLQQEEEDLVFDSFDSSTAFAVGCLLKEEAEKEDREVMIRITRESDQAVIFQYMMDSKSERNIVYAEGKRQASLLSGHASIWPHVKHSLDGSYEELFEKMPQVLPVGGAFPVTVNGERAATICVSGLHEGKDHELIVRTLYRYLGKEKRDFPFMLV